MAEMKDTFVDVGFEVLTAPVMKTPIFCDIIPCSPVKVDRRFGGHVVSIFRLKNKPRKYRT
jgi:hypothetical protein